MSVQHNTYAVNERDVHVSVLVYSCVGSEEKKLSVTTLYMCMCDACVCVCACVYVCVKAIRARRTRMQAVRL